MTRSRMTVFTWLQEKSPDPEKTNLQLLTELLTVNGGWEVTSFGLSKPSPLSTFGRSGLTHSEGMQLLYMSGVMDAFSMLNPDSEAVVDGMIKDELKRVEKEGSRLYVQETTKKLIL